MTDREPLSTIEDALDRLSPSLLDRSGAVFYSGKEAFVHPQRLYLLGLNPGGDPIEQAGETIGRHIIDYRHRSEPWSAYLDDRWRGSEPGAHGMQPRILHMLRGLGRDPRLTPASNVVFVRSRNEKALQGDAKRLLQDCWPVHQAVIATLGVQVIVCFGGAAGRWTRRQLGADKLCDQFTEANARRWRSVTHAATDGRLVVTVTHPGRADWRNCAADPTPLIRRALDRASCQ